MEVYQIIYAPVLEIYQNGSVNELVIDQSGAGRPGLDGRSVEMRVFGSVVQWRRIGDALWTNLFDVASIVVTPNTDFVVYNANATATPPDSNKIVLLDGTSVAVTYLIDPVLFANKSWKIRCINDTNTVKIAVSSPAIIEAQDGSDQLDVQLLKRETLTIISDGTKIIIL